MVAATAAQQLGGGGSAGRRRQLAQGCRRAQLSSGGDWVVAGQLRLGGGGGLAEAVARWRRLQLGEPLNGGGGNGLGGCAATMWVDVDGIIH